MMRLFLHRKNFCSSSEQVRHIKSQPNKKNSDQTAVFHQLRKSDRLFGFLERIKTAVSVRTTAVLSGHGNGRFSL